MASKYRNASEHHYLTAGMCFGISIGVAIGVVLDHISFWISIGLLTGLCIGSAIDYNNQKQIKRKKDNDEKME